MPHPLQIAGLLHVHAISILANWCLTCLLSYGVRGRVAVTPSSFKL